MQQAFEILNNLTIIGQKPGCLRTMLLTGEGNTDLGRFAYHNSFLDRAAPVSPVRPRTSLTWHYKRFSQHLHAALQPVS